MKPQTFLNLTDGRPPLMLDHPVQGGKAWSRDDVSPADWEVAFSDEAWGEVEALLELLRKEPLPMLMLSPDQFDLAACAGVMARVKANLVEGMGLAVLSRMPLERLSREEASAVYWLLGRFLARPVATKWDGTMAYDVRDTGRKPGYGVRGSWTNRALPFHTDNAFGVAPPDYVSLLCLHPAQEGGISRFCSLYQVHNLMLEHHPALLARLYRPGYFDRQAEHAPEDDKVSWAPTFSYDGENLFARLAPGLVRRGYKMMEEEPDTELSEALDALEEIMADDRLWVEFTIQQGQMQYLNNLECAHFRSEFIDHEQAEKKRHMVRIWYREKGRSFYNG